MRLTAERARELLDYDELTGVLTWKQDRRVGFHKSVLMARAGGVAGTARSDGRLVMTIDSRTYLAYRLAWLIHFGVWPDGEIDHINGNPTDNRLCNLRAVSRRVNQENLHRPIRGKSSCQLLGAYGNKRNAKSPWKACITVDGQQRYIGVYRTAQEAHDAYLTAKRRLHEGCTL